MPDEIKIDTENGIIIIRSSGYVTGDDVVSSSDRILEIYKETGINKVLIDAREQVSFLKTIEAYMTSEAVADNPRSRTIRYAVLPAKRTLEEVRFLETTSINRGLQIMIHDDKESAISWLKGK